MLCADISAYAMSYDPIPIYPSVAIPIAVAFINAVVNPASGVYLTTRSFPTISGKKVPMLPVDEYASLE